MGDTKEDQSSNTAWLALLVAIVALLFSVISFNRTGTQADTASGRQQGELMGEGDIRAMELDAQEARLMAIRTRLAAGRGYEQAAVELEDIRENVRDIYADASSQESRQKWRELDKYLEEAKEAAEEQDEEVVIAVEKALEAIRKNIEKEQR